MERIHTYTGRACKLPKPKSIDSNLVERILKTIDDIIMN